jgi:hypothetical protein
VRPSILRYLAETSDEGHVHDERGMKLSPTLGGAYKTGRHRDIRDQSEDVIRMKELVGLDQRLIQVSRRDRRGDHCCTNRQLDGDTISRHSLLDII